MWVLQRRERLAVRCALAADIRLVRRRHISCWWGSTKLVNEGLLRELGVARYSACFAESLECWNCECGIIGLIHVFGRRLACAVVLRYTPVLGGVEFSAVVTRDCSRFSIKHFRSVCWRIQFLSRGCRQLPSFFELCILSNGRVQRLTKRCVTHSA